ncbi:MAG: radical SAM protein, partial [Pyrinomonadaceae bacterium]
MVKLIQQGSAYRTYSPEDCPYESIIVDVTHRCNMACRNCYIPNRTIPDLDAEWLSTIFAKLPRGKFIRLVGAEPTMRDDLPDLIRDIRAHKHHPILLTNGLKFVDRAYIRDLKKAGLQIVYLSMNGGFSDELYYSIDSMRCAKQKSLAFENLKAEHIFTSIGMIIVRGINEHAVGPLLDALHSARNVREFHLRSVGAIGRYMKTKSLDLDELLDVFSAASGIPAASIDARQRTASSHDFRFNRLRIQLTQWPDLGSVTRGRLTQDGMVAPAFEHQLENEGGY